MAVLQQADRTASDFWAAPPDEFADVGTGWLEPAAAAAPMVIENSDTEVAALDSVAACAATDAATCAEDRTAAVVAVPQRYVDARATVAEFEAQPESEAPAFEAAGDDFWGAAPAEQDYPWPDDATQGW
jgi:hypothetical protein